MASIDKYNRKYFNLSLTGAQRTASSHGLGPVWAQETISERKFSLFFRIKVVETLDNLSWIKTWKLMNL